MEQSKASAHAKALYEQASKFLEEKQLLQKLKKYGEVFLTGSYALNLMVWRDIDLQLVLNEDTHPCLVFLDFLKECVCDPSFIESKIVHFKGNYKSQLPRGFYLGLDFDALEYGGRWKLDIWVLGQRELSQDQSFTKELKAILDKDLSEIVLGIKFHMMANNGLRVPPGGSYFLYQLLLKGIRDPAVLIQRLKDQSYIR